MLRLKIKTLSYIRYAFFTGRIKIQLHDQDFMYVYDWLYAVTLEFTYETNQTASAF
jgi:hypothetical protein